MTGMDSLRAYLFVSLEMARPRQVKHLPPVLDLVHTLAKTIGSGDQQLLVSLFKVAKQSCPRFERAVESTPILSIDSLRPLCNH